MQLWQVSVLVLATLGSSVAAAPVTVTNCSQLPAYQATATSLIVDRNSKPCCHWIVQLASIDDPELDLRAVGDHACQCYAISIDHLECSF